MSLSPAEERVLESDKQSPTFDAQSSAKSVRTRGGSYSYFQPPNQQVVWVPKQTGRNEEEAAAETLASIGARGEHTSHGAAS